MKEKKAGIALEEIPPAVKDALESAAPEGHLACAAARELADLLGVETILIGQAADALGIKIVNCGLACF